MTLYKKVMTQANALTLIRVSCNL